MCYTYTLHVYLTVLSNLHHSHPIFLQKELRIFFLNPLIHLTHLNIGQSPVCRHYISSSREFCAQKSITTSQSTTLWLQMQRTTNHWRRYSWTDPKTMSQYKHRIHWLQKSVRYYSSLLATSCIGNLWNQSWHRQVSERHYDWVVYLIANYTRRNTT